MKIEETEATAFKNYVKFRKQMTILGTTVFLITAIFIIFVFIAIQKKLNSYIFAIITLSYAIFLINAIWFLGHHISKAKLKNKYVLPFDKKILKEKYDELVSEKRRQKFQNKKKTQRRLQKNLELEKIRQKQHEIELNNLKLDAVKVEQAKIDSELALRKGKELIRLKRRDFNKILNSYINSLINDLEKEKSVATTKEAQSQIQQTQEKLNLLRIGMNSKPNAEFYQILEIDENATEQEIKVAYRNLARKYHPDLNKNGDGKDFLAITTAYKEISKE